MLHAALKPGGKAFFYENNAGSRLLVWCREHLPGRFGIPKYGDDAEFPLTPQEVDMLRSRFTVKVHVPEMLFFGMAAAYLFRKRGQVLLENIDEFLFKKNLLTSYSYRQLVLISGPPKAVYAGQGVHDIGYARSRGMSVGEDDGVTAPPFGRAPPGKRWSLDGI